MYFSILLIFSVSISCKSDHATSRFTHTELDVVNIVEEFINLPTFNWDDYATTKNYLENNATNQIYVVQCKDLIDTSTFSVKPLEKMNKEILERIRTYFPEFKHGDNIWVASAKNHPPYGVFSTVFYVIDSSLMVIPTEYTSNQNSRRCTTSF
ncbi:MAG: hypothetical protein FI685_04675 [SAR202 cluster bacterium]|nr:hypothetical protein [SAR202 cluster bacterium]